MLTVHHLIMKESIGFIHKIIFNENPKCIFKLLEYSSQESENIRKVRKMRIKYDIIYEKVRQSLLYRSLFLLNTLEYDHRSMNPKKLSRYLKENIIYIFANNKIPKNETKWLFPFILFIIVISIKHLAIHQYRTINMYCIVITLCNHLIVMCGYSSFLSWLDICP